MTLLVDAPELTMFSVSSASANALAVFPTELGWMALATRDGRLVRLTIGHDSPERARADLRKLLGLAAADCRAEEASDAGADVVSLVERLADFAAGSRDDFLDIPVAIDHCPPFSKRVLAACRKIPYGRTQSYAELAVVAGSPRAARAVGRAMATNPLPLVIPCHRVLGSGGKLGGYSAAGGLSLKRRLLDLEGADHGRS
jgi:methylated-DNA-[protein]-cysteine S-methyltransferase